MHDKVARLIEQEMYPEALSALDPILKENPDDAAALYMLGYILIESDKPAIAYVVYRRVMELAPDRFQTHLNYGKCLDELDRWEEARDVFLTVLEMDPGNVLAYANLSTTAVKLCRPHEALRWAEQALCKDFNQKSAILNKGFAKLMLFDYSGWTYYATGMGWTKNRDAYNYYGEPRWDGRGGNVVIYGEQGIGDQIAFSQAFHQAIKNATNVYLHCNEKLHGLFKRSFGLNSYAEAEITSDMATSSISMSELQMLFMADRTAYTGLPYLYPDRTRVKAWNAILPTGKPRVGISWTGGSTDTQRLLRSTTLDDLLPILRQDVHWVSLEYKDRSMDIEAFQKEHGIKIHDYPWMTQTKDYDDTAALLANLDLVISVPQSVVHLAGAMGVECWVLQSETPHFFFGVEGQTPIYGCLRQFRRRLGDWSAQIEAVAKALEDRYAGKKRKAATVHGHVQDDQGAQEGARKVSTA